MTLSIKTLCHYAECRCAECRIFFIMLNVVMLSVIMLNVVAPIRCSKTYVDKMSFGQRRSFASALRRNVALLSFVILSI